MMLTSEVTSRLYAPNITTFLKHKHIIVENNYYAYKALKSLLEGLPSAERRFSSTSKSTDAPKNETPTHLSKIHCT